MSKTVFLDSGSASIQHLCRQDKRFAKLFSMIGPSSYTTYEGGSVSYTHLDVYKRQLLCLFIPQLPYGFRNRARALSVRPHSGCIALMHGCLLYTSRCV